MRANQNVTAFIYFSVQKDWIGTLEFLVLLSSKATKARKLGGNVQPV
jgi:hypothetical protein